MGGALIHKQQLTLLQFYGGSVHNVGALTGAHINRFHIIVAVLRKMDETGMGSQGDPLTGSQQLLGIDGIIPSFHIQGPVNGAAPIENCLFLFCDPAQTLQDFFVHFFTSQQDLVCRYYNP